MPDFLTQYNSRHSTGRFRQNPGNSEHILYSPKLDDDGNIQLVEAGKEDIYAAIQSHKDSVDIHVLLARYRNGELDVLTKVQGAYGDFTEMPKTYAEVLNAMIAGENLFNSLPVETREKFDHSFEKFMLSMDNFSEFAEKMGFDVKAPEVPVTAPEEVTTVES